MLARLIAWSMRNAWLVLGLAVALAAGGLYALRQTPLDALPDLSDVQVIVHVDAPDHPCRSGALRVAHTTRGDHRC